MFNIEYQKILGPFERNTEAGPDRNKLIMGKWACREFEILQNVTWLFTEKVDGTNVRVFWDGHRPRFGGRTDDAQMPVRLLAALEALFPEEILEQAFGANHAILFGEGYGAGIQKGGVYRPDPSFVLFDVAVPRERGHWWLERPSLLDISAKMNLDIVPEVYRGPLSGAILTAQTGIKSAWNEDHIAEGLVGTTAAGLLNRSGERIIVKLKTRDLQRMQGA